MGRRKRFTHNEFIDAAVMLIAENGPGALTISALSERIGAPVGSVYHRFPSRDVLLAELWLKIVESFQGKFLRILETDGLEAALYGLQWFGHTRRRARYCCCTDARIVPLVNGLRT